MLKIKKEFKELIPPLTGEELKQLEENCKAEGIRDAILTWNGYIIDGHNRYDIAQRFNLSFATNEKHFDNENDVVEWMILNQFGRRNLSSYQRSVLALQLEEVFSERAKEKMLSGNPGQKSDQGINDIITKPILEKKQEEYDNIWNDKGLSYDTKVRLSDNLNMRYQKEINKITSDSKSYVYIMGNNYGIKIGYSKDPESRLQQLKTGSPDLELLFTVEGGIALEKKAHKRFKEYEISNEWFNVVAYDKIKTYLKNNAEIENKTKTKIAKVANVSHDTIAKVKKIEAVATPEVKAKLATGEVSINQAYQEIKKEEKKIERIELIEKQIKDIETGQLPELEGLFDVVSVDPPWPYEGNNKNITSFDAVGRRVANPYPEMSIEQIKKIELPLINDAVVLLWTTHKFLPDAFDILKYWNLEYKATLVWNKEKIGMGAWFRMQCEFCLVGIKGKPYWNNTTFRDILNEPRREHSRKPDGFFKMIEQITLGRRLEYFSREKRDGWEVFGNDIDKF